MNYFLSDALATYHEGFKPTGLWSEEITSIVGINCAGYLGNWTTALSYEIPPKFALINLRFLPKASQNVFSTKTTLFIFLLSRTMFLAISMPIQFCGGENAGPNDENAKPNSEHSRSPVLTFLTTSFILGDGPFFTRKTTKILLFSNNSNDRKMTRENRSWYEDSSQFWASILMV